MPLAATHNGLRAAVQLTRCENLPDGPGYVEAPLPGAGPFRCPFAGACQAKGCVIAARVAALAAGLPPAPKATPEAVLRRELLRADAVAELVAAALAPPLPLAWDLHPPAHNRLSGPAPDAASALLTRHWTARN